MWGELQDRGEGLHELPPGGRPGEADRDETQGDILAVRPLYARPVRPQVRLSDVQPGHRAADEHPLDF
jgi:hypothetical protein